ncbi:MAG: CFI-box-CTERM domain-containing protein [Dehalococcoidia bacterium]
MRNRKIFLPALLSIALIFSLILPAPAVGASVTVPLPGNLSISRSTAEGSRLAYTMAPNKPQGRVTLMVAVGEEAQNNRRTLSDAAVQYQLTVGSTEGGSVITPGEGTFTYDEGTMVSLVEEPDRGYNFVNWTGDIATLACQCHSTTITLNGNYHIMANFKEVSTAPTNSTCFIATAAYGTPMARQIQILREFRDKYLLTNPPGRAFMDFYYRVSPPIAKFITEHPSLKPIVRAVLLPAVAMSTIAVNTTPAEKAAIAGLLTLVSAALVVWATRRRHRGSEHT